MAGAGRVEKNWELIAPGSKWCCGVQDCCQVTLAGTGSNQKGAGPSSFLSPTGLALVWCALCAEPLGKEEILSAEPPCPQHKLWRKGVQGPHFTTGRVPKMLGGSYCHGLKLLATIPKQDLQEKGQKSVKIYHFNHF